MKGIKTGLAIAAGIVVGAVTMRAIRERRRTPRDEAEEAVEAALHEARTATDHAAEAVSHVRVAGEKAIEHAREEYQPSQPPTETNGRKRLRKVGKSWQRK